MRRMISPASGPRPRVVGRYALHEEIAAGGMASIYLGKMCGPVGFSPLVAIKSMHPQFSKDPEFVRMFLDEARLAGRIRHPNIVPVIDVHAEGSELFLVLEYVHGESLGRLVSAGRGEGTPIPMPIVSAILGDVLQGLHAAHEAKDERGEPLGLVHRDVSPQNILVGADGVSRVLDFGVAKAAGRVTSTRDGQVKGKFAYMAPEQLKGEPVDRRADVYSASVVLWEALTGERLYRAENEGHLVQRVLLGTISPPSSVRPDIPAAVDALVMRGLSRERTDRFGTAKEMALALSQAVPPASTPEVGEWVEGRALDALEKRARLVAEVLAREPEEAVAVEAAPPVTAPTPAQVAMPERASWMRLALLVAGLVTTALFGGYALAGRVGPAASPAPPADSSVSHAAPGASSSVAVADPPAPSASVVASSMPPSPMVEPPETRAPAAGVSPPRNVTRTRTPPASGKAACQRRGPDGEIEFDIQCLRASQHTL